MSDDTKNTIEQMTKDLLVKMIQDPNTRLVDVDYTDFTGGVKQRPNLAIITCDISKRTFPEEDDS